MCEAKFCFVLKQKPVFLKKKMFSPVSCLWDMMGSSRVDSFFRLKLSRKFNFTCETGQNNNSGNIFFCFRKYTAFWFVKPSGFEIGEKRCFFQEENFFFFSLKEFFNVFFSRRKYVFSWNRTFSRRNVFVRRTELKHNSGGEKRFFFSRTKFVFHRRKKVFF